MVVVIYNKCHLIYLHSWDTVYCKSFEVEKFRSYRTNAGKHSRLDGSLAGPKPTAQAISLEKFRGTDQSVKTAKFFHLERFAIYDSMWVVSLWCFMFICCTQTGS